jgi:hypothetical protein
MADVIASCAGCTTKWKGLKLEHCPLCHETFTTTRNGDLHRVGPWSARRCLTEAELIATGKVAKNSRGYWAGVPRIGAAADAETAVKHEHTEIYEDLEETS